MYIDVCVNSKMMDVCGEAESRLATELMQHEVQIERDILDPLNQLAEVKTQTISPLSSFNDKYICLLGHQFFLKSLYNPLYI